MMFDRHSKNLALKWIGAFSRYKALSHFQQYLDLCDLTDQIHAVKAMLNGHLLGVDLES